MTNLPSLRTVGASLLHKLLGPGSEHVGEIIGDFAASWRLRNLAKLNAKLGRILPATPAMYLSPRVALPLLEKASYEDDDYLQEKWAHLIAGALAEDPDGDFSLEVTYIEIMNQMTRLDCRVLEYVSEQGVEGVQEEDGSYAHRELSISELAESFGRMTHIVVEKLVSLGVVQRVLSRPLRAGSTASGFEESIAPTVLGLNFYAASAGKMPGWMSNRVGPDAE